jgi:hypothetical protein
VNIFKYLQLRFVLLTTTGVRFPTGAVMGFFLFATASTPALGPNQPPNQWVAGALSTEVERKKREANHSPLSTSEVKNAWSYTCTPAIRRHGAVKHRDNFTIIFT